MSELPDHLFEPDGDRWVPSALTAGPWDPAAQHGGPPTALLGRCLRDHEPGDVDWFLARITVELERPVPLVPLRVEVELTRPGRRVQVLDAALFAGDDRVARARGLRLAHTGAGPSEPGLATGPAPDVPRPTSVPRLRFAETGHVTFAAAIDIRPVVGLPFLELGPAQVWFDLEVPVVAGQPIDPLDRVLTAADFPNGISNVVPFDRYVYINPDLTVHLHRLPDDEWVLLDATTWMLPAGHGQSSAAVSDRLGRLGTANQSLMVWAR